jgi:hypothetical protein
MGADDLDDALGSVIVHAPAKNRVLALMQRDQGLTNFALVRFAPR